MDYFKKLPLHPVFISVFSVIFLAANNTGQIPVNAVYRPLGISLLFGLTVYGVAQWFLRNWQRSGLVASITLFMFSVYGQLFLFLKSRTGVDAAALGHAQVLPWYGLVFGVLVFVIWRWVKDASAYTFWLNSITLFLLIQPIYSLGVYAYQQWAIDHASGEYTGSIVAEADQPDVYYIILDAYGREDILADRFGFDNSEFLNALRKRGFYVADCSQSNYGYTEYSLASSLNFDYLENLDAADEFGRIKALKQSNIRSFLETNGYTVVAFPTGWSFTEWYDADLYVDYPRSASMLSEYETFLLNTTLLRALENTSWFDQVSSPLNSHRRARALSLLSNLGEVHSSKDKLFVYAHLMLPHPPYSFSADGTPISFKAEKSGLAGVEEAYLEQVRFVNQEILKVIDLILSGSDPQPVIILQGDHGPPPELSPTYAEKMPILNAYYLPNEQAGQMLYPSISPVNSFRVVLNAYFGQDLPMLEDKSYYAPNANPDVYELVPNSCSK